jgi:hypothetical protein
MKNQAHMNAVPTVTLLHKWKNSYLGNTSLYEWAATECTSFTEKGDFTFIIFF